MRIKIGEPAGVAADHRSPFAGVMVAVSGAASAFFVTLVNAFMNGPGGLEAVAVAGGVALPVVLACGVPVLAPSLVILYRIFKRPSSR